VLGHPRAAVMAPVPGETNRYVFTLPQPDGLTYVGLTDEPVEGQAPDVPQPTEHEVDFLLGVLATVVDRPLTRHDVVGAYAGLRPLLHAEGRTADLSRRHAVLTSPDGVVTVVGGKLTTYRRMAQDAVDHAATRSGLRCGPCRTARLPLVGAAPRSTLATIDAPERLVRRYGIEAPLVARDPGLLRPVGDGLPCTLAELAFGVSHEGALDVDDLLDRRTRIGLVPADRAAVEEAAASVLAVPADPRFS
jgi:glycerol-3-phosphate dehydrogenase